MSGPKPPTSLGRRITRRAVVPLLTAVVLLVAPLAWLDARDARNQVIELAERRATSIALLIGRADDGPTQFLEELSGLPGEAAALVDADGHTIAGAPMAEAVRTGDVVAQALQGEVAGGLVRAADVVVGAAPLVSDGDVSGAAVVALPADAIAVWTRTTMVVLGLASVGLVAAAALAGRSLARAIVRPIETLDLVAARLAAGDLDVRAHVPDAPPELQRLAATLNHSAAELQRLLALQRSFVADASHQLRTPLAGLRLQLENVQLAGGGDGRLGAAMAEVDRLTGLVNDLLALARAEQSNHQPVEVDAAAVARSRVVGWTPVAAGASVEMTCDAPPSAPAWCVPGGLEQVLDNLLANALNASPDGGRIDVAVTREDHAVVCRVVDHGPGMTEEERGRAFERFWRSPGSDPQGGSGLGLPIAAELIRASRGTIELQSLPSGGLVVEVRLPAVESAARASDPLAE